MKSHRPGRGLPSRLVGGLLVLGLAATACGSRRVPGAASHARASTTSTAGGEGAGHLPTTQSAQPGGSTSTSGPKKATDSVERVAAGQDVSNLALWDHYLAWAAGPAQGPPGEVHVYDRTKKSDIVVAKGSTPDSQTDWVRGTGEVVVYTEESRVPSDSEPTTAWKIIALDLRSGRRTTLDQSRSARDEEYVPLPAAADGWIVWDRIGAVRKEVRAVRASGLDNVKTVVRDEDTDLVVTTSGFALYTAAAGEHRKLLSVNLETPTTPSVLAEGDIAQPAASSGWVAWHEPIKGDPTAIWVAQPGGAPIKVFQGPNSANPAVGTAFVAWMGMDGVYVKQISSPTATARRVTADLSVPARLAAYGNTLAWAEANHRGDPDESTTIFLEAIES